MPHDEDRFHSRDGLLLYEQRWLPETAARAVLVIVHGFAEHSGRYARLAGELNAHGYSVYGADLRGHGRSQGEPCYIQSFEPLPDDLEIFLERIRRREPGRPLFLLGHSLGGTIAIRYAIARQPDLCGLILSAPGLRIGRKAFPWLRRLAPLFSRIVPRWRVVRMGARMISHDAEVVAGFRADPLVFHDRFPIRTGAEILRAMQRASAEMEMVRVPLLILHGTGDLACDCEGSRELFRRAASTDKQLHLYPGLYHEVFSEPERGQVLADLLAWLAAR
ncbi:MAG: lysophospholipase [Thermoguttaceae bacterium]|jgi:alpha-beta hydrolase superfamily lysophospholipase